MMQSIWSDLQGSGHVPRTREQIDAEIGALPHGTDEERLQAVEKLHEECKRSRKQKRTPTQGSPLLMVFLDTCPVIYLVEQPAIWGPLATARIAALLAGGERMAVSDLVRMECHVGPLKTGGSILLAKFNTFFASPDVQVLPVSPAVCNRPRPFAQLMDSRHLMPSIWRLPLNMAALCF